MERLSVDHTLCPSTATAQCDVRFPTDESSTVRAHWFLDGVLVEGDDEGREKSAQDLNGVASYYFSRPCTLDNFGNLTCQATYIGGENSDTAEISHQQSIHFVYPVLPNMAPLIQSTTIKASQSATIVCTADGYPAPQVEWTVQGVLVVEQANKMRLLDSRNVTHTQVQLVLENAERADNDTYVCEARNKHGSAMQSTVLYVQNAPLLTTQLALGVGTDSVYLNWTVNDGNLPVLKYTLKYLEDAATSWNFAIPPEPQATSYILTGI